MNAIFFDFNGVIVDDENIHFECFERVLRDEEISLTEKEYWETYLGFDDKGLFEAIFEKSEKKLTPKKLKDLIQKKNDFYNPIIQSKLRIYPGVKEFIAKVKPNYHLAVVSGALRSEIEFVLEAANLKSNFLEIVSADDTKHGKPDPEGYLMGLAKLKKKFPEVRAETSWVIEDSLAGIESAKRAGMKVIAVTNTYSKEELSELNPDQVVDHFDQIVL